MTWIAVAVGGALGAMARHGLNAAVPVRPDGFPLGIFLVNVAGCLAIGAFTGLLASDRIHATEVSRTFIVAGVLGGFTTFSTFGIDTFTLARGGHAGLALLNAIGQVVVGLVAVWVGFAAASWRP
jgi:fluoride exporter